MPQLTDDQYKQLVNYLDSRGYSIALNNTMSCDYEITTTLNNSTIDILLTTDNMPIKPRILLTIHNKSKNRYQMRCSDWYGHSSYTRFVCDTFDELMITLDSHINGLDKSLNILHEKYQKIKYEHEMLELQLEKSPQAQLALNIVGKKFSKAEISTHMLSKPTPIIEYRWNIYTPIKEEVACQIRFNRKDFRVICGSRIIVFNYNENETIVKDGLDKLFS